LDTEKRLKSLEEIVDNLESMRLEPNMTQEEYKRLIRKIALMLFSAYDKGFYDGKQDLINFLDE
jgi:hypothetical protein